MLLQANELANGLLAMLDKRKSEEDMQHESNRQRRADLSKLSLSVMRIGKNV